MVSRAFRFNWREILRAPRLALRPSLMGVHFAALVLNYLIYCAFTTLAMVLSGHELHWIWDHYGLFPLLNWGSAVLHGPFSWLVYFTGILLIILIFLNTSTLVSRIAYLRMKGDYFYSVRDAREWLQKNRWSTPKAFLVQTGIILVMLLTGVLAGWLVRIPFAGPLIFVTISPLLLGGSFLILLALVIYLVIFSYGPALAATWCEDGYAVVIESFNLLWREPWRVIGYGLMIIILGVFGLQLYGWAVSLSYLFMMRVLSLPWLAGDAIAPVIAVSERLVFPGFTDAFTYIPGKIIAYPSLLENFNLDAMSGWEWFTGSFGAIVILLIYLLPIAYVLAIWSAGHTLAFVSLFRRHEGRDLIEYEAQFDPEAAEILADMEAGGNADSR